MLQIVVVYFSTGTRRCLFRGELTLSYRLPPHGQSLTADFTNADLLIRVLGVVFEPVKSIDFWPFKCARCEILPTTFGGG